MGFPRILSKNNKIYTKLGEFCLSGDSFWIVCHTCQEELQTQDQFWKHIQDEHNFMHGVAKVCFMWFFFGGGFITLGLFTQEHSRTSSYCLTDVEAAAAAATPGSSSQQGATAISVPLALYTCSTKYSEEEQREVEMHEQQVQHQVQQQQAQQQQAQQQQHQQSQQQGHQQHQVQQQQTHQQLQQQRDVAKELAELHANAVAAAAASAAVVSTGEGTTQSNSAIDIKIEPSSLTLTPEMQAAAAAGGPFTICHS